MARDRHSRSRSPRDRRRSSRSRSPVGRSAATSGGGGRDRDYYRRGDRSTGGGARRGYDDRSTTNRYNHRDSDYGRDRDRDHRQRDRYDDSRGDRRDRDRGSGGRRYRDDDDDYHNDRDDGAAEDPSTSKASSRTGPSRSQRRKEHARQKAAAAAELPVDPESLATAEVMEEMAKVMGFAGFDTTKNKSVDGNPTGDALILKPRKYRQYMNRKGGFNRPLDYIK